MALLSALYDNFQSRGLKLYVNVPVGDNDFDLKYIADHSDGILLMNYEQHLIGTGPGPIAAQDWFVDNLKNALKVAPKKKIICSIGSYGYDWKTTIPPAAKKGVEGSRTEGAVHPGDVDAGCMAGRRGRGREDRARS